MNLTNKQKVGQFILAGFHGYEYNDELKTLIEDYNVGNFILFTRNFDNALQLEKLTRKIHEECLKHIGIIPLIAIDQEGGLVTRLTKDVTFAPGAMTSSASAYPHAAYECGKMIAKDLIRLGINVNLAPVVDVNCNPKNPVINVRSYSDNKERVAALGKEFIKGTVEQGVLATCKHFPGHGDANVDSHLGLPVLAHSKERMKSLEMYPFIENIDVPCIMSAHILFEAYEKDLPATLSRKIITGVLREELGYQGIIFSDCLEMNAIKEQFGTPQGARLAIRAGIDIADISHTLAYQTEACNLILEDIESGILSMDEVNAKIERILAYKAKTKEALDKEFYNKKNLEFDKSSKAISYEIVKRSITFVRGEKPSIDEDTYIVTPVASAITIIEDEFEHRSLKDALQKEWKNKIDIYTKNTAEKTNTCNAILEEARKHQKALVFSYNAAVDETQVDLINQLSTICEVTVVSLKGPFDASKYPNVKNYSCMYEYTPNSIKAIVEYLKGNIEMEGTLPITL